MEYDEISKLINDMSNSKLSQIDIELKDGTKISMSKEENMVCNNVKNNIDIIENKEVEVKKAFKAGNIVKSPMVGTFYAKPSPSAKSYVEIGSNVKVGDVLCIVEAMKLMNEIESEFSGKITEIFVKDGESVEYGTPLFSIE